MTHTASTNMSLPQHHQESFLTFCSAPFFDMSLDVNRDNSDAFSVTLRPTVPGSDFSGDLARKVCLEEHHARLKNTDSYDVAEEYGAFTECVVSVSSLL